MPLDAITPTFINAPVPGAAPSYDAEVVRRDMGFMLAGGATADVSRSGVLDPRGLTVTLSGSNVQVNPAGAAIDAGKGAYLTGAKTTATIDTLTQADATNPRRDRVVLEILDPDGGGGPGRKGQFRVITGTPSATAASGGGFPTAPTSPSITLAHIDVPKVGGGNPTVTDLRPFTAAAGAPIPVRNKTEQDALPKWDGALCARIDLGGSVMRCNGTLWIAVGTGSHAEFRGPLASTQAGIGTNPGVLVIDGASKDTAFVEAGAAGTVKVLVAGVYGGGIIVAPSTSPGAASKAIISANGEVLGVGVGSSYGGNQFGATMLPKFLAANTVISYSLVTTTGVNIGSLVTLTRIG